MTARPKPPKPPATATTAQRLSALEAQVAVLQLQLAALQQLAPRVQVLENAQPYRLIG